MVSQHGPAVSVSVGTVRVKAGGYVVDNWWVTPGTVLFVEQKKLTSGKARIFAYWLIARVSHHNS